MPSVPCAHRPPLPSVLSSRLRADPPRRKGLTKVVVTGGAGFIGANLCRVLRAADGIDEVVAFDNLATGSSENLVGDGGAPVVDLVEASILDSDALDVAF